MDKHEFACTRARCIASFLPQRILCRRGIQRLLFLDEEDNNEMWPFLAEEEKEWNSQKQGRFRDLQLFYLDYLSFVFRFLFSFSLNLFLKSPDRERTTEVVETRDFLFCALTTERRPGYESWLSSGYTGKHQTRR